MSLRCELGWHEGDRLAPWNNGYYFSKCRRCRRDIVKASTGGWFAPKGFRVVWQGAPPEHRRHAELTEESRPSNISALPPVAAAAAAPIAAAAATAFATPSAADEAAATTPSANAEAAAISASEAPPPPLTEEALPEAPPEAGAPAETQSPEMPPTVVTEAAPADPAPLPPSTAGADRAAAMRNELPIQEVLRHLEQEAPSTPDLGPDTNRAVPAPVDAAPADTGFSTAAPAPASAPPPPTQTGQAGGDFDFDDFFLEDEAEEKSWELAVEPAPPVLAAEASPNFIAPAPVPPPPVTERLSKAEQPAAPAPPAERRAKPREEHLASTGARATKRSHEGTAVVGGTLFLAALTAGLLAYLFTPSTDEPQASNGVDNVVEARPTAVPPAEAPVEEAFAVPPDTAESTEPIDITPSVDRAPQEPPILAPEGSTAAKPVMTAVVTASIINCRSNASEAAPTIRKMLKGARVDVLASQAGWVNVSYRGKQCWIADRYLDEK